MCRVKNTVAGEDHPEVAGDVENVAGIGNNLAERSYEGWHGYRLEQPVRLGTKGSTVTSEVIMPERFHAQQRGRRAPGNEA
jgi:hypothetical protein